MNAGTLPVHPEEPLGDVFPLEGEMVELSLLLPGWQAQALETAAHDQGVTAGQMLRSMIRDFCARIRRAQWQQSPGWDG